MPRAYVSMRDKFIAQGTSRNAAQAKAARIYNARRGKGERPVTGRDERSAGKEERPNDKRGR